MSEAPVREKGGAFKLGESDLFEVADIIRTARGVKHVGSKDYALADEIVCFVNNHPRNSAAAIATREEAPAEVGEDEWAELERLADEATPGDWRVAENDNPFADGRHVFAKGFDGSDFVVLNLKTDHTFVTATSREQQQKNALFAAAANPAVIKRLIAALRAQPQAREEAQPPTCQKCGGEIAGWHCQHCPAEFRENDDGALVFDEDNHPAPEAEKLRVALHRATYVLTSVQSESSDSWLVKDAGVALEALAALQQEGR